MKNFYDRFAFFCHQPHFLDKACVNIVTTELSGAEETLKYMAFPPFTWGFRQAGELDAVYESFQKEGAYRTRIQQKLSDLAQSFHHALTTPRPAPGMKELAFFNVMKTKVTFHADLLPRDYEFWKEQGWLDRNFYHENGVNPIKSAFARFMVARKIKGIMQRNGLVFDSPSS